MKTIIAALAGASLLTAALPVAAQSHHGGGWSHGGASGGGPSAPRVGGAAPSGFGHNGVSRGAFAGRPGFDAGRFGDRRGGYGGYRGYRGYRSYPYAFGGFGLGLALGLSAYDPWYYDAPYYGYYAYGPPPPVYYAHPAYPPAADYPPPPAEAAPSPPAGGVEAPAACGSWSWDTGTQVYVWTPC